MTAVKRVFTGVCAVLAVACRSRAHHPPAPAPAPSAGSHVPPVLDAGTAPPALVGKLRDERNNALPGAANPIDLVEAVTVSVVGQDISVDDDRVDTVLDEIAKQGRLRRLNGLFQAMKERREAWKQAHPGQEFPGVALFRFTGIERAAVV